MPVLSWICLVGGQCPSLPFCTDLIASSPLVHGDCSARVYQFHVGLLRELHCGLYLSQFGNISKNPSLDINAGVDWIFRRNGIETLIAIGHAGNTSRAMYAKRKHQKLSASTVVLTAPRRGDGKLDLVLTADIEAQILSKSAASSASR